MVAEIPEGDKIQPLNGKNPILRRRILPLKVTVRLLQSNSVQRTGYSEDILQT